MSVMSSSTNSTLPARQANDHDRESRLWNVRGVAGLLGCVVLFLGFVVARGGVSRSTARPATFTVQDKILRRQAILKPTPTYPSTSLAKGVSGVVVATVTFDGQGGRTRSVKILESPDAATGQAVRDAVGQWTLNGLGVQSRATAVSGNLVFYFHLVDGKAMVLSAEELQAIRGITTGDKLSQAMPPVRTVDEAEFSRISQTSAAVVLDTRSRTAHMDRHRDGAVNIPLNELGTRAKPELPRSGLVVIDCFAEQQSIGVCGMAASILAAHGFSELAVLNRSRE